MLLKLTILNGFFGMMRHDFNAIPTAEKIRGWKRTSAILIIWLISCLLICLLSKNAYADPISHSMLDNIAKQFNDATGGWSNILVESAHTLFFYLACIEIAWAGMMWVMDKDNLTSFTTALIKKIIWLGFFYALLLNFDVWVPAIINSFSQAGKSAAHIPGLSPSFIAETGLACLDQVMSVVDKLGFFKGLFPSLMVALCSLFILGCFFMIALQLLIALVESYIIISAGVIFLGFGGSRVTCDFVQKYLGYAVAVGVKIFMVYLIVSVGSEFSKNWALILHDSGNDLIRNLALIAGAAFIYAGLVWTIPKFAANLMSSASTLTATSLISSPTIATTNTTHAGTIKGAGEAIDNALKFTGNNFNSNTARNFNQEFSPLNSLNTGSSFSANNMTNTNAFNMPAPKFNSNNSTHGTNSISSNSQNGSSISPSVKNIKKST